MSEQQKRTNGSRSMRVLALLAGVVLVGGLATACTSDDDDDVDHSSTPGMQAANGMGEAVVQQFGDIEVIDAWARATPGNPDENSAAYAVIRNTGSEADRLVGASVEASVARTAEIHQTVREGDSMRMEQVEGWEIPAGGSLELMPGANHVMLMMLAAQFVPGEVITVTLEFERAGFVDVQVPIKMAEATSGMGGH